MPVCGPPVSVEGYAGIDVVDNGPVYQIPGVEDGDARCTGNAGCHHIIVLAHAYHVGVRIVGMYDGIAVCAVAIVGHPHLSHCVACCQDAGRHE